MEEKYETKKGLVTISDYFITINDKVYAICSEDYSIGEFEDYVTQEISNYYIADTLTKTVYNFVLYYEHIASEYYYKLNPVRD